MCGGGGGRLKLWARLSPAEVADAPGRMLKHLGATLVPLPGLQKCFFNGLGSRIGSIIFLLYSLFSSVVSFCDMFENVVFISMLYVVVSVLFF